MNRERGFSLVEVLIVTIMIGILAMIVVPKFMNAQAQARDSALSTDLMIARRQIEYYVFQHEYGPHIDDKGKLKTNQFVRRMTERTYPSGKLNPNGTCGPYMTKWPANQFVSADLAQKVNFGEDASPPRDGTSGWYYCTTNCLLSANSTTGAEELDP